MDVTKDGAPAVARGPTVSMEALSPFFKKKAHILEVLRRLEETDPLKFHPGSCLSSCCCFSPALLADTAAMRQSFCCHSCSDSSTQGVANGEERCRSALLRSQKHSDTMPTFHQPRAKRPSSVTGWPDVHGTCTQDLQASASLDASTSKHCEHSVAVESSASSAGEPSQIVGTDAILYSAVKDAAENGPTNDWLDMLKGRDPREDKCCDRLSSVALNIQPPLLAKDKDSLTDNLKHIQSVDAGPVVGMEECCFRVANEAAAVKNCLHTSTSCQPAPGITDQPQIAYFEKEVRMQICNGQLLPSREDSSMKNMGAESYFPDSSSTAQQPSSGTSALALNGIPISCFSEDKASPISSPSRLLRFLKIPPIGERTQGPSPLRLSPQLTRNSKIPCRTNNYEVYHSQKATTTERSRQSSSSKTHDYPAIHSAPTSPPQGEEESLSVGKAYAFDSHSTMKSIFKPKLTAAHGRSKDMPHYENVSAPGHIEGAAQLLETVNTSHFHPYPSQYGTPERNLSSVKDKFFRLSNQSPITESSVGLEPSSQNTCTEGKVWYKVHSHHSLPNSSALHKAKDIYTNTKERTRGASQSYGVIHALDGAKLGELTSLPKKQAIGRASEDSSNVPVKERLAALGKLRSTDDFPVSTNPINKTEPQCSNSKAAGPSSKEKSKTGERQDDRILVEHKRAKYTGSLDGKSYPKVSLSGYSFQCSGPCPPYEPGAKSLPSNSSITRPELETFSRIHVAKTEDSRLKMSVQSSSIDPSHVLHNYVKCTSSHSVLHNLKTAASPQSSPNKASSKSPSRPGQASSYPRGTKLTHNQRHLSVSEDRGKVAPSKKKISVYADGHPPSSRPAVTEDRRPFVPGPRSAIEHKVMKGIEENMLKLQEQDHGQAAEVKQKSSNGIASWFGLRKSKLPALSRKPDVSKPKDDKKEWRVNVSSVGKDAKLSTKKKLEVESLNISKLMEKAEDLRRALEEERAYMKGVALDRPGRGHSCEVVMDRAQGQLSVMYRGLTSENFMQQLLNRVDERDAGSFGLAHRHLSFDSKKVQPTFSHHRDGVITHTKSTEDMEKGSDVVSKDDITSEESLAESVSSQHFAGSGASTHTLDSGIGTFPLPNYTSSAAGKNIPKTESPCCGRLGTKVTRRARTMERELSSLEEGSPRDMEESSAGQYRAALEEKGSTADDPYASHIPFLPSNNQTFHNLRASAGQTELYLGVPQDAEWATCADPPQIQLPSLPPGLHRADTTDLSLFPCYEPYCQGKHSTSGNPEVAKDTGLELVAEQAHNIVSLSQI